jgi:hypothetical protein
MKDTQKIDDDPTYLKNRTRREMKKKTGRKASGNIKKKEREIDVFEISVVFFCSIKY